MIACNALINSDLNVDVKWLLLDTTAVLPIQPVSIRALKAMRRVAKLIYFLLRYRVDGALIFCGSGYSFVEKGLMVRICVLVGKPVYLAPRSGLILRDLEKPQTRRYIANTFRKCKAVICQSAEWKTLFSGLLGPEDYDRFQIIHNWVDEAVYHPNPKSSNSANVSALFMGWVVDYKGIYELIEAVNSIKLQCPGLLVHICGNGDDYGKVEQLVISYDLQDIVTLHGWVDFEAKIEFLATSDIFVIPSHYEGFPNALLEAMSAGLPCIASDVGAIRAAIDNGINGYLISPKSIEAISNPLKELYFSPDLRKRIGSNARQTIIDQFSKKAAVQNFRKLLIENA